jgi:hypothetical protein
MKAHIVGGGFGGHWRGNSGGGDAATAVRSRLETITASPICISLRQLDSRWVECVLEQWVRFCGFRAQVPRIRDAGEEGRVV